MFPQHLWWLSVTAKAGARGEGAQTQGPRPPGQCLQTLTAQTSVGWGVVWATVDMKKLKFCSNFFLSIVNE